MFAKFGQELQARGFQDNIGTIVNANIIVVIGATQSTNKILGPDVTYTIKGPKLHLGVALHMVLITNPDWPTALSTLHSPEHLAFIIFRPFRITLHLQMLCDVYRLNQIELPPGSTK